MSSIQLPHGERISVTEAVKRFDVSPVIKRFGTWAVTTYGVECLSSYYPIARYRLNHGSPHYPWERHLAGKVWVVQEDMESALAFGREHHGTAAA